jgi:outer membrane protein, heavy metal efflux system
MLSFQTYSEDNLFITTFWSPKSSAIDYSLWRCASSDRVILAVPICIRRSSSLVLKARIQSIILLTLSMFWASSAASAAPILPLSEALARAVARNPAVLVAKRRVDEARATQIGAGVPFPTNPRLFADYRRFAFGSPPFDPRNGYNLGVDLLLEVSGAGQARIDEATRRTQLALFELTAEEVNAKSAAWSAYVNVQLAEAVLQRVEEAVALGEQVLSASQQRNMAGVAAGPDLALVEIELAQLRVEQLSVRAAVESTLANLRQVIDAPADELIAVTPLAPLPETPAGLSQLAEMATERRSDLKGIRQRIAVLDAGDRKLALEAFPKIGINGGLDAAPASPVFGFAGISVELPVAQRNQGPRAVNRAATETERTLLLVSLNRVKRDIQQAHALFAIRAKQFQLLQSDSLQAAERNERLVAEGWRSGRFDVFRYILATRELLRIKRQIAEAQGAAWQQWIELQRVSGALEP